jgi:CYTH domain-containing protein/predicted ATPase
MKCIQCKRLTNITDLGSNIWVIVETGGPCSGKTTGLAFLEGRLTERGYKVLVSPESATKLIMAGMKPGELTWPEFQEEILKDQLAQEERMLSIAKKYRDLGRKVVVLCDRGAMDGEAYVGTEEYSKLLKKLGYRRNQLCNDRYHVVIHLRTAALGAEGFYSLANNKARIETAEEARALDQRTLDAWTLHSHARVIDNGTDFAGKLDRLFAEVCAVLGDPIPFEREQKFLIEPIDPSRIPITLSTSRVVQDYLTTEDPREEARVRSRITGDGTTYYHTTKRFVSPGMRVEVERIITRIEYEQLLLQKDPRMQTIKKSRICFFWKEQFTEIDVFEDALAGLAYLEVERTEPTQQLQIPPFITVIRDVTADQRFANASLAKKGLAGVPR